MKQEGLFDLGFGIADLGFVLIQEISCLKN